MLTLETNIKPKSITFICPYCQCPNEIMLEMLSGPTLVFCAIEQGGCDQRFIANYLISYVVRSESYAVPDAVR